MSWAEVKKINSNMAMPLNEQLRELSYAGAYLITESGTFSPDKTGWYKVIVVSRGGDGYYSSSTIRGGSSGGVAIKTILLKSNSSYPVTVDNANSTTYFTSFNDSIICYNAANSTSERYGASGTAVGGDYNYNGMKATSTQGKDVGVFIPQLMQTTSSATIKDSKIVVLYSGSGILGHGGGQTQFGSSNGTENKGGCVLIIPLEIE